MTSNQEHSDRRDFLRHGALTAAGGLCSLLPKLARAGEKPVAASEQVRIGVIGCGNRANQLMSQMPREGLVVAVADCYLPRAAESFAAKNNSSCAVYQDYRRLLDREQLDAVLIATPDHARTLPAMHAVAHGLDVYAEKPLTAYVREGRLLVEAVRKHGRVFQVGTQQRSMEINRFCCEAVRTGRIGAIKRVSAVNYPGPAAMRPLPEVPVPEGDDWDMWCGPAPLRPFNPQLQFGWMAWRDYSGGEMTNWGAHGIDQIQWALGKSSTGPTELWPDPATGFLAMQYEDGVTVHFEREKAPMGGAVFEGTECKLEINRNRFASNPADFLNDAPPPAVQEAWEGEGWIAKPHLQNWIDCIKSRKLPKADVETGHRSVTVCHLLNITRELGRPLKWDPDQERFVGDDEANSLLDRPRRSGYELPVV